jgi:hypothetical protein
MELVNEMPLVKTCIKCKIEKPAEANFVKNANSKDLYHSTCKQCIKEYQQANKEKMQLYQKQYQSVYRKENAEELMAYDKVWREANREKCKEYAKKSMTYREMKKIF